MEQNTLSRVQIREYKPGDAGLVSHLHMKVYTEKYGFRGIFEHYVMKSLADFLLEPTGGMLWVAEIGDKIAGSAAIVRADEQTAQLRWFVVDDGCQGTGIGSRLLDTALDFCRDTGYTRVTLWTISMLGAARHLYAKKGFFLTETKPNTEWTGELLTEERWDLVL